MVKKKKGKEDQIDSPVENIENTTEPTQESTAENNQESIEINLQKELADMQDKHIRLHAEFDNFRRRTLKEKSDIIKSAGESTLINLLPVVDDLERALDSINTAQDLQAVKEGIELIVNKFESFLKQNGVQEIPAKDLDFDTDKHEAITKFPAPSPEQKGKVIDVVQKGYELNEKVIRFAKVVVGE